jgi:Flp pilus assembly secretin CpaC
MERAMRPKLVSQIAVSIFCVAAMLRGQEVPNPAPELPPGISGLEVSSTPLQMQLNAKLCQLEMLQEEISELRRQLNQHQQIVVSLKCVEVNLTKLKDSGFDFAVLRGKELNATNLHQAIDQGIVEALLQNNLAKVLSEPTLMTFAGRPCYVETGGDVPYSSHDGKTEYKECGTKIELKALVTNERLLRIELRTRYTEIELSGSVSVGGKAQPGVRRRELDTGIEVKPGETFVVGGSNYSKAISGQDGVAEPDKSQQFATVWLVKADLAESDAGCRTPHKTAKKQSSVAR